MLLNYNRAKKAVDWYINMSESAIGICSNWFATTNTNPGSQSAINPETIIYYLKDIKKHRHIHQALKQLTKEEYRMFTAIYDDEYKKKYPSLIKNLFGDRSSEPKMATQPSITGLALCLCDDFEWLLKTATKKNEGSVLSDSDHDRLQKLKELTNKTHEELHTKLLRLLK